MVSICYHEMSIAHDIRAKACQLRLPIYILAGWMVAIEYVRTWHVLPSPLSSMMNQSQYIHIPSLNYFSLFTSHNLTIVQGLIGPLPYYQTHHPDGLCCEVNGKPFTACSPEPLSHSLKSNLVPTPVQLNSRVGGTGRPFENSSYTRTI